VRKITEWLPSLHDPSPPRLWRIGYALALCFVAAVAGLALLWLAARWLLGNPHLKSPKKGITVHDTVGVAQLVFASVAGAGALVALVVAYRRQRVAEDRSTVFNERFATAATQLGDSQPAVRLAGAYAMAGLADDWVENRQTCVDVLCAYLRLPYDPDPGKHAPPADRAAYLGNREVRHTIIRIICDHLRPEAAESWQRYDLDFTGVVFDGGDFQGARFTNSKVSFRRARFSGGRVSFEDAVFGDRSQISFREAKFDIDGRVSFRDAQFIAGEVGFPDAEFSGGEIGFPDVKFSGGEVSFRRAKFVGGGVSFRRAQFSGSRVDFDSARFSGEAEVDFEDAAFSGGQVYFEGAAFSGGQVYFGGAAFSGGQVSFHSAEFSGGQVYFTGAEFSGGQVDFSRSADWSQPPEFGWDTPPAVVTLPAGADATPA
jgi:uncharacterized protein YjbI with pentapeptide repeats